MSADPYIQVAIQEFDKTIAHLNDEYSRLQVGRANASLVEHIMVDSYGSLQPLKNLANISVPEAMTLQIQPWDKGMMAPIEKAIQQSDLGLNPINNGAAILLNVPALTEERRKDLVKIVGKFAEEARISIRNARQTAHSKFKSLASDKTISEDDAKGAEKKLQDKVDASNVKVAELAKAKEEGIMTV
jgi:ribosome recycling factor